MSKAVFQRVFVRVIVSGGGEGLIKMVSSLSVFRYCRQQNGMLMKLERPTKLMVILALLNFTAQGAVDLSAPLST